MSAWVDGELDCICSLDQLARIVRNIMPQWAKHIQTDPNGQLRMFKYNGVPMEKRALQGPKGLVSLLIPGSGNPQFKTPPGRESDNDWGFYLENGKWKSRFAEYNAENARKLNASIAAEAGKCRLEDFCKQNAFNVTMGNQTKSKVTYIVEMTEEEARQLLHA